MKRTPLRRRAQLRARTPLRRTAPLARTASLAATDRQRLAVAGRPCIVCGATTGVDPAHLIPRSLGGCGDPLCVVPLCRRPCHRAYDSGELDLLPHLEPAWRAQLVHAVGHVGLIGGCGGSAARLRHAERITRSVNERLERTLELMCQQRLERRAAARALPRAALGAVNPCGRNRDRFVRQPRLHAVTVRAMSDALDDDRVYVESEAAREHPATVAPPRKHE